MASGQKVETFVADEWTFEYDLAFHGLGKHVHRAASLALADDRLNAGTTNRAAVLATADAAHEALVNTVDDQPTLASHVYALFEADGASKAIGAQYLAELLEKEIADGALDAEGLRARLPPYVVAAIAHVTGPFMPPPAGGAAAEPNPPAAAPNPMA